MSYLVLTNINKQYNGTPIVNGLSLDLKKGATLSILGKSGCGKTTLLKMIAGLLPLDDGKIELNGNLINDVEPAKRGIVYLYQEPLLFPHLNVSENIAFGLKVRKVEGLEISDRVHQTINDLGLKGHEKKMPGQLSGGQRQRVAFGRAIIINPAVLLLDEPFGNLDSEIRSSMQAFFKDVSNRYHISTLFVTHDLKEALLVGDELALMENGQLTTYSDKQEFINDTRTGASNEVEFWKQFQPR